MASGSAAAQPLAEPPRGCGGVWGVAVVAAGAAESPRARGPRPSEPAPAEPLDEPPGVCDGLCGLAVLPAVKQANSVVTVLPMTIAPAARAKATQAASAAGRWPS